MRDADLGDAGRSSSRGVGAAALAWREFQRTPLRERFYISGALAAAAVLPLTLPDLGVDAPFHPTWATLLMLVTVSVVNVELGRALGGGLSHSQQPHKALSAWAFASALLLPVPWLLVVVPITYSHARWRGLRTPLWKWLGSGAFLVLAGVAAAATSDALYDRINWMYGTGGRGLVAILAAAAVFLVVEAVLFAGTAWLNDAADEQWLRRTLRGRAFYLTEIGVLVVGGLLSAAWTGGAWYVVLFLPVYAFAQRAVLHEPLRERAEMAALLENKNRELEQANQFKEDLLGMLGHEIGNPLTSNVGYARLSRDALESGDTAMADKALSVVERSGHQIRQVLHEVLETVRSEHASLIATPQHFILAPHLTAAASHQPPGRQPVVDCPDDLSVQVQPGHLDQMLGNLLSNAEKYAGGATRLCARAIDDRVELLVEDAGPGVPDDVRDRLFQRFTRGDETAGRVVGTGLGLFITRELARANGGDVTYRDGDSGGAIFTITLPC